MEFKGTPWPWETMLDDEEINVIQSGSFESADGYRSYITICEGVCNYRDASLIAAAPELLEALKAALDWIDAVPSDTSLPTMPGFDRDWVDSVINKALGSEHK
jgi:hypothetical protein